MIESSENSDGNASWSNTINLKPPGVYEAEKQLEGNQITALKNRFLANPELIDAASTHIVERLYEKPEDFHSEESWWANQNEFDEDKSDAVKGWKEALEYVIQLPGPEWPEWLTPAATFNEAINELETIAAAELSQEVNP